MFVKAKDQVVVISGKDKGVKGKVVTAAPKTGKVVVEGVAMMTKHQKARQQGQQGGIIKVETPIYACKVMVVCPKCGKPTRVGHKIVEVTGKDGKVSKKNVRVCHHKDCGAQLD